MAHQLVFPPDVEEFIDDLIATAILRAINNGTYVQRSSLDEVEKVSRPDVAGTERNGVWVTPGTSLE